MSKLWTKNFTIITFGTIISMFGSAASNFALGLIIFEKTNSPFLYSLFFIVCMIPMAVVPMFAGPFVDRFSRRKIIYTLDFMCFVLFALASIFAYFDYFNYFLYMVVGFSLGIIASIYNVAYESFYPILISEGNYSKAYSISSLLYPLANTIMAPVSAIIYSSVGLFPLFVFDAISFLIAALLETQIKVEESQTIHAEEEKFDFKQEFKEGITYLKEEKGLATVTKYFFVTMLAYGVIESLLLPFFQSNPDLGATKYSLVLSAQTLGRILGGFLLYKIVIPKEKKFNIAIVVYATISILDCIFFFSPFKLMLVIYLVYGVLGVTSFNIRTSATQSYVPNDKRGRFNGIFAVITMIGTVIGKLIGGVAGEVFYIPYIIVGVALFNLAAVYFVVYRDKKDVKLLYNRDV